MKQHAKVRISKLNCSTRNKEKGKNIEKVINEKEDAIRNQDFEKAANLRDKEKQLKDKFDKIKNRWKTHNCIRSLNC